MFRNHRLIQYLTIILILAGIAGGYFYYQSKGAEKVNSSKANNLTSNLVGYWTMDGNDTSWSGDTATLTNRGSIGSSANGTSTGMSQSTSPTLGKIGQALNFNGSNSYAVITDNDSLDSTNKLTISAWVKPTVLDSGAHGVVVKRDSFAVNDSYNLFFWHATADWCMDWVSERGCWVSELPAGQWYHVVAVFDGTVGASNRGKLYVNNVLRLTSNVSVDSIPNTSSNLHIGSITSAGTGIFNGSIDEVRIYKDRALSASEITELYNQGQEKINASQTSKLTSGLVGYWTMDGADTTSTTITDKSPSGGNNGTLNGAGGSQNKPQPTIGRVGQGLKLDGTDDYIEIANNPNLNFNWNTPFSISALVKRNGIGTLQGIITKSNDWPDSWRLHFGADNKIYFMPANTSTASISAVTTTALDSTTAWYHIVGTYDGSGNNTGIKIYVNGVISDTTLSGGPVNSNITNSLPVAIGVRQWNGSVWRNFFNGSIDETRIYNRALSASEITELYNQGQEKINASQSSKLTSGLVLNQTFDGNNMDWSQTTAEARDQSTSNYHGDVQNITSGSIGKIGQALNFNGSTGKVSLGATANLNFLKANSFSASAWVKRGDTATGAQTIINNWYSASGSGWTFRFTGNTICLTLKDTNDNARSGCTTATYTSTSDWYHVAATYNGTATGFNVYVNGQPVSITTSDGMVGDTYATVAMIGMRTDGNFAFNGKIDEVRVYNRVLSASEITELYNQGR